MNHIIIKELHRTVLISKLSGLSPTDIKSINDTNPIFRDILKLIVNNDMCYIQNEHAKCYIFTYSNIIYIGIHSTMDYDVKNKLTQLKDDIYIHDGVFNVFVSIEEQLIHNIMNLDKNKFVKKIYVTGYGVAGSIANVVSAALAEKYKNMYIVSCYTFGSQPVGNKSFRKWFIKNVSCNYRVQVNNDVCDTNGFTKNSYSLKYYHVSDELRLTKDNIVNMANIDVSLLKKMKCLITGKKQSFETCTPIDTYVEYLKTILSLCKSNICRTNQIRSDSSNIEESDKPHIEIPAFSWKKHDGSFKSGGTSISSTATSPIFTSIKSPKQYKRVSPHKPSPHRNSSNSYTHQGPLTDEFIAIIIQKLDNANHTLSKYLEHNIRRTSSSNTLLTSGNSATSATSITTTPTMTSSSLEDTRVEKMFINTKSV